VLRTPARAPQANGYCERLVGTVRRECLDLMIPLGELHLRQILKEWVRHYNQGRPHASLGQGFRNPWRYPSLQEPIADTSQLRIAGWRHGRFSVGSITSTGGKGSRREGQTAEETTPLDHLATRMADDRGTRITPSHSRAGRARGHATPNATSNPSRGHAGTECFQLGPFQGMVRGSREEGAAFGGLLHRWAGGVALRQGFTSVPCPSEVQEHTVEPTTREPIPSMVEED
jgi:hypothetical protein